MYSTMYTYIRIIIPMMISMIINNTIYIYMNYVIYTIVLYRKNKKIQYILFVVI